MMEQIQPFLSPRDNPTIALRITSVKGENILHLSMGTKEWSVSLNPAQHQEKSTVLDIPLSPLEILESIIN